MTDKYLVVKGSTHVEYIRVFLKKNQLIPKFDFNSNLQRRPASFAENLGE